jgi:hypothetical protein
MKDEPQNQIMPKTTGRCREGTCGRRGGESEGDMKAVEGPEEHSD